MKTRKLRFSLASLIVAASWLFSGAALADPISISAGCPGDTDCDPGVSDVYSFSLVIEGTTAGTGTDAYTEFTATLTNTTSGSGNDSLIDNFWLSLNYGSTGTNDGTAGPIDPYFDDFTPATWDVLFCPDQNGSPCNVTFTYAGDPDTSGDRLGPGDDLVFTINFSPTAGVGYDVFTDSPQSNGTGGSNDLGQFCVSFQRLDGFTDGSTNQESDQVCGDWTDTPRDVAEPGTLALLGLGLLGLGAARRRRKAV